MTIRSLKGATYAIADVETNGMSLARGQVIEIGIIRVEDGEIADTYQTLIRPNATVSGFITGLTGIRNDDLLRAPSFEDVAPRIAELLEGAIFVAYNARFDYSFIKTEFRRLGMSWNARTLCTVKVSRKLFPAERGHSLDAVMVRHGIACKARHRAYDDAYVLWEFLQDVDERLPDETEAAVRFALGNYTLPAGLDASMVRSLPHAPGVYLFYDADDTLLYVGKSIDIRARVMSHFSGDHLTGKERALCEGVARIEHEVTSGELSALLRESALVKELAPVYNRKLRKVRQLALMTHSEDAAGYRTVSIAYGEPSDAHALAGNGSVFKSVAQGKAAVRKAAVEHALCPKLLGLEKGAGACFSYQLGTCKGACKGIESPEEYNKRFDAAFARKRMRAWPFGGPILLPEDPEAEEGIAYAIDQWRILKTYTYTPDGFVKEEAIEPDFDYDSYKILSKHLLNPSVRKKIKPMPANLQSCAIS